MNFVLRNFFYGVGLTLLFLLANMPPNMAEFHDLVVLMNGAAFWKTVGAVASVLAGLDLMISGRLVIPARPPRRDGGKVVQNQP